MMALAAAQGFGKKHEIRNMKLKILFLNVAVSCHMIYTSVFYYTSI
jgi:hypothetical protein